MASGREFAGEPGAKNYKLGTKNRKLLLVVQVTRSVVTNLSPRCGTAPRGKELGSSSEVFRFRVDVRPGQFVKRHFGRE